MYTTQQNNYNIPYAILILWKVLKTTLLWQVNVTFKTILANKKEQIHVVRFGQHEAYRIQATGILTPYWTDTKSYPVLVKSNQWSIINAAF